MLAPDGTRDPRWAAHGAPGRAAASPLWTSQVDWPQVLHELGLGDPLKFIWEERAQSLTSYPNFWQQLYRKHPELRQATVTARDFAPGERVEVDYGTYYSAAHIHRGKKLRIRLTQNQVEIFLNGERLALHPRDRSRSGKRVTIDSHFPDASIAYYEATPQHLLSQSRFIHPELNQLIVELFNVDVYGNIRRVQGLIRSAGKEINAAGREVAIPRILAAIAEMRRVGRVRVPYFCDLVAQLKHQSLAPDPARDIVRQPGNPLLRYAPAAATDPATPTQESLL